MSFRSLTLAAASALIVAAGYSLSVHLPALTHPPLAAAHSTRHRQKRTTVSHPPIVHRPPIFAMAWWSSQIGFLATDRGGLAPAKLTQAISLAGVLTISRFFRNRSV